MRAAMSLVWVGLVMTSRANRAVVGLTGCVLTPSVLAVTLTSVTQAAPSMLTWMVKPRVFQACGSPPAAAWLITKRRMVRAAPRSTWRVALATALHHLLLPVTTPSVALAGDSAATQAAAPAVAAPRARLVPGYPPPSSLIAMSSR